MTKEELRTQVVAVPVNSICYCASNGIDKPLCKAHARIEALACSLLGQAYEKAAQEIEKSKDHNYEAHVGRVALSFARDIRTLKDSL